METFNKIIEHSLKYKTSDIHLGVGYRPVIRIDGKITFLEDFDTFKTEHINTIIKDLLDQDKFNDLDQGREVDFSFSYNFKDKARFRVNVYKERKGINLALRYIPDKVPTIDDLDFPEVLKKICEEPYGLILITGPTGSGKSTTLAAMLDHINKNTAQHIITIEDPIEFIHDNQKCLVKQRAVGEKEDTHSYPQALRAALREDPDVLLIGEMRDLETIKLAMTAAETGHLVLSTLHTNNTYQTINRVIDIFPTDQQDQIRGQLAQNLIGVIAQRLLPKRGGGRIAALEILLCNSAVRTQIREKKIQGIVNTIKTNRAAGMILLEDYIEKLADNRIIDPRAAQRFLKSQAAY